MATDATGTPTALGIPTYNVNADAPSGNGFNAAMAEIDTLIQGRILSPAGIQPGEWATWNGSAWVRSTQTTRTVVGRSIFTSGSGTYNLPTGVQAILVELLAGGGSGGQAQTGSQNAQAAASGGWGGSYVASLITNPSANYVYAVGAGGAAVAGGGTAGSGNAGGDSTFGTLVAKGGPGGVGDNNAGASPHGTPFVNSIGSAPAGNVGDIKVPGGAPTAGWVIATNLFIGGRGGDGAGPYGGPGAPAAASTAGGVAGNGVSGGLGAGSSGSASGAFSSGDFGVAAGGNGLIVITEFH